MTLLPSPDFERHVRLAGVRNLRDVGGYPADGGRTTRWRTLFRADALDRLPATSQRALLDELGIRTVIDLRWPDELVQAPNVFAASDRVRYLHLPLLADSTPRFDLAGLYRHMLDRRAAQIVTVGRTLIEPGGLPAVIHCAGGRDRTGVTVAVLLAAVAVPSDTIVNDYALSDACFAVPADDAGPSEPPGISCPPEVMVATLEHLERAHGGAERFLVEQGFARADLARLRELLTEPAGDARPT